MKKNIIILTILFISFFMVNSLLAQEIISSGNLSITVTKQAKGVKISSIKKNDTELLDTQSISALFTMLVDEILVTSYDGWDSVAISNTGSDCSIVLTNPTNSNLSDSLMATITISTSGNKSDWDMSVTGLGSNSLMEVNYPYLNIKASGNDYALIPRHSGQLIPNPKSSSVNESLQYPRWAATMQFCAYYNDNYGIYFGTHDPKASIKQFKVKANNKDGVIFSTRIPTPNRTLAGNNWEYSGKYRLELFEGDWYEASQIYREWASEEAEYWPTDTPERIARREAAGNIAIWMLMSEKSTVNSIKGWMKTFVDYMGDIPVGIHWYEWTTRKYDDDYPYFFPEKSGMDGLVSSLQGDGSTKIMPYTNGRMYDKGLPNYQTEGKVWAVKKSDGSVSTQTFGGINFAVECPTQEGYQDILVDAAKKLTDSDQLKCGSVYIDQVAYASANECYDTTHGHPIGGGDAWRSGYNEMFEKMHNALEPDKFLASEGNCDFIADEIDLFLAQQWKRPNSVPAFQAVYSGKVMFFGTKGGTTGNTKYYSMYANSFVNGVVPGRFYISAITRSTNTYVKRMGTMRNKLKEYLSFGRMLKSIAIERTGIDNITSNWGSGNVTISALQTSLWKNRDKNKAMILFANASMTKTLNFNLDFDGGSRGLLGNLKIQKITEDADGEIVSKDNSFSMSVTLQPLDIIAYIIEPDSIGTGLEDENIKLDYKLEQNYPNPFNPSTVISFTLPKAGLTKLSVFNILGQEVAVLENKEILSGTYEYKFDASNLSSGIYFYKLQSNNYISIKKMMLIK